MKNTNPVRHLLITTMSGEMVPKELAESLLGLRDTQKLMARYYSLGYKIEDNANAMKKYHNARTI